MRGKIIIPTFLLFFVRLFFVSLPIDFFVHLFFVSLSIDFFVSGKYSEIGGGNQYKFVGVAFF